MIKLYYENYCSILRKVIHHHHHVVLEPYMSLGLLCYSPPLVSILSFPSSSFNPKRKAIREEKKLYYKNLIEESENKSKAVWNGINSVSGEADKTIH
jgi:hypothetical protein